MASVLFHEYQIQDGDTLFDIAGRFGLSPESLAMNNPNVAQTMLVGSALRIPTTDGLLHDIVADQPLWAVAALFGVSAEALLSVAGNAIPDDRMLAAGSTILIPGARPAGTPAADARVAAAGTKAQGDHPAPSTDAPASPTATPEGTPLAAAATPAAASAALPALTPPTATPAAATPIATPAAATPIATPAARLTVTPTVAPSPTPAIVPTVAPTPTPPPVLTASPTPEPTATPAPTPTGIPIEERVTTGRGTTQTQPGVSPDDLPRPRSEALAAGTHASVQADGECLHVRDRGALAGKIVNCFATGRVISVLDGAVESDGYRWQEVSSGTVRGWVADMYLEPSEAPLTPDPLPAQSQVLSPASLRAALAMSRWPSQLWPTVERIIECESSRNTGAVGPLGHLGLMQVAPWFHGPVPTDPVGQLNQGYEVYLKQGWGAWECY